MLILHLLECQCQPEHKSGSWFGSIHEQRSEICEILRTSPSLRKHVLPLAERSYDSAKKRAVAETGLDVSRFPTANPYSVEQLLDITFTP